MDERGRAVRDGQVEPVHAHVLVADDALLAVSWRRRTVVFRRDGRLRSTVGLGTVRRRRIAMTDGELMIAADLSPDRLDCVSAATGRVLASTPFGSEVRSVDVQDDGITVSLADGRPTERLRADPHDGRGRRRDGR